MNHAIPADRLVSSAALARFHPGFAGMGACRGAASCAGSQSGSQSGPGDLDHAPRLHPGSDLAAYCHALHLQQRATWPLAAAGYRALDSTEVRSCELHGLEIRLQLNPARLASSTATAGSAAVRARPCFLCIGNLPAGQQALTYGDRYLILVNPYPVAPEHFTVPAVDHVPQRIGDAIADLLSLCRDLAPRYTVLYNGPQCGASVPEHRHFQAVSAGYLPLDRDFSRIRDHQGTPWGACRGVRYTGLEHLPCPCVALEAEAAEPLQESLTHLLDHLNNLVPGSGEPMVNIIGRYRQGWRLLVVPRSRHRPSSFLDADGNGILLSPGTADVSGHCVVPRREDFRSLQRAHLQRVFEEVCLPAASLRLLRERLGSPA